MAMKKKSCNACPCLINQTKHKSTDVTVGHIMILLGRYREYDVLPCNVYQKMVNITKLQIFDNELKIPCRSTVPNKEAKKYIRSFSNLMKVNNVK